MWEEAEVDTWHNLCWMSTQMGGASGYPSIGMSLCRKWIQNLGSGARALLKQDCISDLNKSMVASRYKPRRALLEKINNIIIRLS